MGGKEKVNRVKTSKVGREVRKDTVDGECRLGKDTVDWGKANGRRGRAEWMRYVNQIGVRHG